MAFLNQCNFIGNVGKIETRYMPNGEAVTNMSIACNETWKDKDGTKQEKCEWVNATTYKKLAEIAAEYVKVGHPVFISGKLSTRKWQDKEGKDRYTTEIIVNELQMLGGKRAADSSDQPKPATPNKPVKPTGGTAFDDINDDLPF